MAKYLQTKVAEEGLTKLIQRLGRDCTPTQFVREYVMNSIEAVQRTNKEGKIQVDANWYIYRNSSIYKLCFIDNGDGMFLDEMIRHLNNLSSSGSHENVFENYGMGAKIAALTRNHEGILYDSWKEGSGSSIIIKYNEKEKIYGVVPIEMDDGTVIWGSSISDEDKPEIINEHGTRVTLFGMNADEDTMLPPRGAKGGRENWLYYYINSRFFEIPQSINLSVRIGYYRDTVNSRHNYFRTIIGQKETLKNNSICMGSVEISDAIIHWWILNPDASGHGRENLIGHTGCINQIEIFDIADGRSNRSPNFGIIVGREEVVLYVEPLSDVVQDTTRTRLILRDGSPLPWERWQDEFRSKFPSELTEFIKAKLSVGLKEDHQQSIRKRLAEVQEFYKLSRFRLDDKGQATTDPESESSARTGEGADERGVGGAQRTSASGNHHGPIAEILRGRTKPKGDPSSSVKPDSFPVVIWVSKSNGRRGDDELVDRAACYLERDNVLKINEDFQGITDVCDYYINKFKSVENVSLIIYDAVKEIFEQQLVEAVLGAQSLRNRPEWTPENFAMATSEESLTAVVMCRYHIIKHLNGVFQKTIPKTAQEVIANIQNAGRLT
ncbi:MAG: ATP-binding protein [Nitratireductor sp.]